MLTAIDSTLRLLLAVNIILSTFTIIESES